jgi:ABC-type uncharacterized transport system permease subunit
MNNYISLAAIIFYLLAAVSLGRTLFQIEENARRRFRSHFFICGYAALMFHAVVLYRHIDITGGLNFGFYNALSLMSWGVSLLIMLSALSKPLENLAVAIFPVTAMALIFEIIFHSRLILPDSAPLGLLIHVLLSVCAYSLLTLAAFQSVLLALQDRQISHKHPASIMRLPPMQIMEDLLIKIIALGFFMLSLSLATGLMFVQNLFAQHLVHKTVLSILAWCIFGTLLWGHWTRGWRGKTAIRWTIGGFLSLMLAYFGSKLVLELILKRV